MLCKICGLHDRIAYQPCYERFRFGSGTIQVAKERVRVPVVIAGVPMLIIFCLVESETLPLLLGRDFLGGD